MATFLWVLGKESQIVHIQSKTYHFVKKIVKIDPVYPEIIGLQEIIREIASKTYYLTGMPSVLDSLQWI